jgi:acetylglutamate kinase
MNAKKQRMVLKIGGNEIDDPRFLDDLANFIKMARAMSKQVTLVHGGGKAIEDLQTRLGIPVTKHEGLRVTTAAGIEAVRLALIAGTGQDITLHLQNKAIPAVALSAASGIGSPSLIGSRLKNKPDLGFVGEITQFHPQLITMLFEAGLVPVVAPLAIEPPQNWLNVNADDAAVAVASALEAEELLFITNVSGLKIDNKMVSEIDGTAMDLLLSHPDVSGGMIPKLKAARHAMKLGIATVGLGSLASYSSGTHSRFYGAPRS